MRLSALAGLAGLGAGGECRASPDAAQDSTRNNLRATPGGLVTAPDRLPAVERIGNGRHQVVLIPGAGFGGGLFRSFAASMIAASDVTVHLATVAGFGATSAWPMPPEGTPYADATWIRWAEAGVLHYLDGLNITSASVLGHWIVGSQAALRLAIEHLERFQRALLIAGVAKPQYRSSPAMQSWTPAQRAASIERLAQYWFRTVTETTWQDHNFAPYDYAVNPLQGFLLWRRASEPALSTWIRYLMEFYATDWTLELPRLRLPAVVIEPGLDDPTCLVDHGNTYLHDLLSDSWMGTDTLTSALRRVVLPGSRVFPTYDRPAEVLQMLKAAGVPLRDPAR